MKPRFAIIRLLLAAYPSVWSAEYGRELAAILIRRPLSTRTLLNVLRGAGLQRWRYTAVWKSGGILLMLWLLLEMSVNSIHPLPPTSYRRIEYVAALLTIAIGWRAENAGQSPSLTALKASLLGAVPEFLLLGAWCCHMFRPTLLDMDGSVFQRGSRITEFCSRGEATDPLGMLIVVLLLSSSIGAVYGRIGGLIARTLHAFRMGYRGPATTA